MASNGGRILFGVGFKVDKSGLNLMKKGLQDVVNAAQGNKDNNLKQQFDAAADSAKKLSNILDQAWNSKIGQLNLDKVNQLLKKSGMSAETLKTSLTSIGPAGQAAFNNFATQVLNTNVQLRQSSKLLDSMATSMANTVKWGITSSIFNNITGSIQKAYYYAKDLDRSLTNIRVVTGDSADQMERFAKTANTAAKDLGRSTLDYTKAALSFYQQGLDDKLVQARTTATLKAENITGIGSEMADYLTAVWNGFNAGAEDAELYVDKLAAVADTTASNMGLLATAISKVASAANNVGVDVDQLNGQIATVIATTRQAPESVGTAFKTIYARINDIKAGTDLAEVSLGNYSGQMLALGFNVLDASGHLRDTGLVIEEIGGRWQNLTRLQQINLAQTMAGQRQYNNLIALFDNWDKYVQSVNTSLNAQGTLNLKNDRYMESLEAHMQQLGTEAQRTYDILFDEKSVKGWVDALDSALGVFNDFIDGLGGGTNAFVYFGSLVAGIFNKQIANAVQGAIAEFDRFKANLGSIQAKQQVIESIKNGLRMDYAGQGQILSDTALTKQAEAAEKLLSVQKGLSTEQQKQAVELQKQIGLNQQKLEIVEKELALSDKAVQNLKLGESLNDINRTRLATLLQIIAKTLQEKLITTTLAMEVDQIYLAQDGLNNNEQVRLALKDQLATKEAEIAAIAKLQGMDAQTFQMIWKAALLLIEDGSLGLSNFEAILDIVNSKEDQQNQKLQDANRIINNINKGLQEQAERLKENNGHLDRQVNALSQQGQSNIFVQNLVKGMSSVGMALSSLSGAAKTFSDESATAAQKANAAFSSFQGTISAIGMAFGPIGMGVSTLVNGIISFMREVTPLGLWVLDQFKSISERLEELKEHQEEVIKTSNDYTTNVNKVKSLAEEFENLSVKAGTYNENLSSMTLELQARYHLLVDDIIAINPDLVEGWTSQGLAIINNNNAIKDTLDLLDQQYLKLMAILYSKDKVLDAGKTVKKAKSAYDKADQLVDLINTNYGIKVAQAQEDSNLRVENLAHRQYALAYRNESGLLTYSGMMISNTPLDNLYQELEKSIGNQKINNNIAYLDEITSNYNLALKQAGNDIDKIHEAEENFQASLEAMKSTLLNADNGIQTYGVSNADEILAYFRTYQDYVNTTIDSALTGTEQVRSDLKTAEGKANLAHQVLESALRAYSQYMFEALRITPDYNFKFDEIKSRWKEHFTPEILSLVEGMTKDWVETVLTLDSKYLEMSLELMAQALAQDYNHFMQDTFDKILIEDISDVESKLANLSSKKLETSAKQYYLDLQKILLEFYKSDSFQELMKQDFAQNKSVSNSLNFLGLLFGVDDPQAIMQDATAELDSLYESIASHVSEEEQPAIILMLKHSKYTLQELKALNSSLETDNAQFGSMTDNFMTYMRKFFLGGALISQNGQTIADNFSKVSNSINKLQSGKELNYKLQAELWETLFPDEIFDLSKITDAEYVLEEFKNQVLSLKDATQRLTGLDVLINNLDDLIALKDELSESDYQQLWTDTLQELLEALGFDDLEPLKRYADLKDKVFDFDSLEGIRGAIAFYKQSQSIDELGKSADNAKDKLDDFKDLYGNLTLDWKNDSDTITYLETFRSLLANLGVDVDYQWIVDNIDKIVLALKNGTFEALNFKQTVADTLIIPETELQNLKELVSTLQSTINNLLLHKELSLELLNIIFDLINANEDLKKIYDLQGLSGEKFLSVLKAIGDEAQKQSIKARLDDLNSRYEEATNKIQSSQNTLDLLGEVSSEDYLNAKTIKEGSGYDSDKIKWAEEILSKYELIQQVNNQIVEGNEELSNVLKEQLALESLKSAMLQLLIDKMQTIDLLESAQFDKDNPLSEEQFNANLDEIAGREAKSLGLDEDEILDYADAIQLLADDVDYLDDSLEDNRDAALLVAIANKRMNRGIDDLALNFEKYQLQLNSDNIEEFALGLANCRNAIGDLLNIDGDQLSGAFFESALNLLLMQQAATGDVLAIDSLRMAAATDIVQNCDVYLNGDQLVIDHLDFLNNYIQDFSGTDLLVGATLDDTDFIAKCNQLIADAQMTLDQIQSYFNALGFDPKISYVEQTSSPVETVTLGRVEILGGALSVPYKMYTSSTSQLRVPKILSLTKTGGGSTSAPITHSPAPSGGGGKGGGKGGGGGKGSSGQEPKKPQAVDQVDHIDVDDDPYHEVNIQLEDLNRNLLVLQLNREHLTGQAYLDNLDKELQIMREQLKVQRLKANIAISEATSAKNRITTAKIGSKTLKTQAQFDELGDITNYDEIRLAAANAYNKQVDKYNKIKTVLDDDKLAGGKKTVLIKNGQKITTVKDKKGNIIKKTKTKTKAKDSKEKTTEKYMTKESAKKAKNALEQAKKDVEELDKDLLKYEEAQLIKKELDKIIRQLAYDEIAKLVEKFNFKIEAELDFRNIQKQWNDFLKDVIEDGINDTFESALTNKNNMQLAANNLRTNLDAVNKIRSEILLMNSGNISSIYSKQITNSKGQILIVNDTAAAQKDLEDKLKVLMENYGDIKLAQKAVLEAYLTTIDNVADGFDNLNDQLKFQNDLLEHNRKLLQLTKGDKAYKDLAKYYLTSLKNQNQQSQTYRRLAAYWKELMDKEPINSKAFEEYKKNYQNAVSKVMDATKNMLETITDQYENKINDIFDTWLKRITGGLGLDLIGLEWDYIKQRSNEVLDDVNKAYLINMFKYNAEEYIKAAEGDLKVQNAIKNIMNLQMEILKEKKNVYQYDIDRANLLLLIEAKRALVEKANNTKNKLRLRRDSQGNYTYQYVADDSGINKNKKELELLLNRLHNFTKLGVQLAYDNVYNAMEEFEDKVKDIWSDVTKSTTLRMQLIWINAEKYGDLITRWVDEIQLRGGQLVDVDDDLLSVLYQVSPEFINNLSDAEKRKMIDDLNGGILSGGNMSSIIEHFLSEGGVESWINLIVGQAQLALLTAQAQQQEVLTLDAGVTSTAAAATLKLTELALQELQTRLAELTATKQLKTLVDGLVTSYQYLFDSVIQSGLAATNTLMNMYGETSKLAGNVGTTLNDMQNYSGTLDYNIPTGNINQIQTQSNEVLKDIQDWSQSFTVSNLSSTLAKAWQKELLAMDQQSQLVAIDSIQSQILEMRNLIRDNYAFNLKDMIDNTNTSTVFDQNVTISANFPNASSRAEIELALESLMNRASQYAYRN